MGTFHFSLQRGSRLKSPELARRPLVGLSKSPQTASTTLLKTDYRPSDNFIRFKQSAEKLVQDQPCAKTDLQIANAKLRKSAEQIVCLETKLQHVSNEYAKIKLKLKEDAKLWRQLDSKLSSTKTFYDLVTETLQHLVIKVEEAEGSKQFLEEKMTERLKSFEELSVHLNALSSKLNTAEETIEKGEQELQELLSERDQLSESYDAEVIRTNLLIAEKDATEKQLQAIIEEDNRILGNVQNQLKQVHKKLSDKENACASLHVMQSKLVTEQGQLKIQIQEYEEKLLTSESQREALKDEILRLSDKIIALEKLSVAASNNVDRLLQELDKSTELAQQEKKLIKEKAQVEFDHLNVQFQDAISANTSLKSQIQEFNNQITELQKSLDLRTEEYAKKELEAQGELHDARQELDNAIDKKCQLEETIGNLQENIACLSCSLDEAQKDKEDLMITILKLKAENQDAHKTFQDMVQHKEKEIETLLTKNAADKLTINLRETEIIQLRQESINKSQLMVQVQERNKALEEQNDQNSALVLAAEHTVTEIRGQCELQLEAKQAELTRHLKEISQRNDQEINDIRRRCEAEMRETIIREKENEKLKIKRLQEEHSKEKQFYQEQHMEEMNKKQQEFEKDLKEQLTRSMRDAEVGVNDLQLKHREEMKKLQDEKDMQLKKEEEKTALLELQIKIMKDKLQEESQRKEDDLRTNLQKEFSISSTQVGVTDCNQGNKLSLVSRAKADEMPHRRSHRAGDSIMPKSDKAKEDSILSIPTHSKKITQHEYEIATSDGTKTITKRKRTRSTVMYGEASSDVNTSQKKVNARQKSTNQKKVPLPNPKQKILHGRYERIKHQRQKASHASPSTIGDLFGGGSLDPYAEDPYAFD